VIPIKLQSTDATSPRGKDCGGCKHQWYSAPFGQKPLKPEPHVRCLHFAADIPMTVDKQGSILSCEIPPTCPTHYPAQREMFA
jgi:hypothetical protein